MPQPAARQQYLVEDEAFLLESRGILHLRGKRVVEALQPLVTVSLDHVSTKPVLAYVLDNDGFLIIDLFVVGHSGDLLIDCDISLLPRLMELLSPRCEALEVVAEDAGSEWRVLAELPNQNAFADGSTVVRYVDPRWHMGARVIRRADAVRSSQWGREIKWATHALKLGFLPSTALLQNVRVSPLEAGLHALNLLNVDQLPRKFQTALLSPEVHLKRRLLPMRIEPDSPSIPTMNGGYPVLAGDLQIGEAIAHHGLFALALVDLDPWRMALADGIPLHCADQSVLITWPSWLAQESRGKGGPVAKAH